MIGKGIVFFFEGEHRAWFAQDVTATDTNIRGYVLDGCWWMDYIVETSTVNVCIARKMDNTWEPDWKKPINTFKTRLVDQINVPHNVDGTAFELLQWARTQKKIMAMHKITS